MKIARYALLVIFLFSSYIHADEGISVRVFDGFLEIPNEYYVDNKEREVVYFNSSKSYGGKTIYFGEYSPEIDINTNEGKNYYKNYEKLDRKIVKDLSVTIFTPKSNVKHQTQLYLTLIHNNDEYMMVTSRNDKEWVPILETYRIIKKAEYIKEKTSESDSN